MRVGKFTIPHISWRNAGVGIFSLMLMAYFLAGAARALMAQPQLPALDDTGLAASEPVETIFIPALSDFSSIRERNVFKAARPDVQETTSIENLPVVQLSVKLLGTIDCDVTPLSRAIVLEGDKQRLVKVGDSLGGHSISEIQRRAVVLLKGGQKQVLLIDLEEDAMDMGNPGGMP